MTSYSDEEGYIQLLRDTLTQGEKKDTRNGTVYSQFATVVSFTNVSSAFPLLTTKRIFVRGVIEELLWFLTGSSSCKPLQEKNVHIWDKNSSREYLDSVGLGYEAGELGPIYGWQWRSFGKSYSGGGDPIGVDQIKHVVTELLKDNSRRAVLSSWNPQQLHEMALPPCHVMYTFYRDSNGISCLMNMRSSDLFLGLPFNIASTALLLSIIAKVLHSKAYRVVITSADAHIYEEHVDSVKKQVENEVIDKPTIRILKEEPPISSSIEEKVAWIDSLVYEDFAVIDYMSAPAISAVMK